MTEEIVLLDGKSLTIDAVGAVARKGVRAALHPDLLDVRNEASGEAEPASSDPETRSPETVPWDHHPDPRMSLISDTDEDSAPGMALAIDQVRAGMLVQANHLAGEQTLSHPAISTTLLEMLERNVSPHIPSPGASGALGAAHPRFRTAAMLPDLSRVSWAPTGARAWYAGELLAGEQALRSAGLDPQTFPSGVESAFTSETAFCAGMLALALLDAQQVFEDCLIAAAMSLEALLGVSAAFDERLHLARLHPGQVRVAQHMRDLIRGSSLIDCGDHVQDAYSLRCVPQVLGPVLDLLQFNVHVVERELNPTAGWSHAARTCAPIALAADNLKTAFTTCGAIAERRIFRLLSDHTNRGLPAMLVTDPEAAGLQSGMMMLQYTAASLVHENQSLAAPAYACSRVDAHAWQISSEAAAAVQHLNEILDNVTYIAAMEMITAAQALDLRLRDQPDGTLGLGAARAHKQIRERVPHLTQDRPLSDEVHAVVELLASGRLTCAVMNALDEEQHSD